MYYTTIVTEKLPQGLVLFDCALYTPRQHKSMKFAQACPEPLCKLIFWPHKMVTFCHVKYKLASAQWSDIENSTRKLHGENKIDHQKNHPLLKIAKDFADKNIMENLLATFYWASFRLKMSHVILCMKLIIFQKRFSKIDHFDFGPLVRKRRSLSTKPNVVAAQTNFVIVVLT